VIDFVTAAPTAGSMDVVWQHGRTGDVPIQVHYYDPHTVILRQSKALSFEAPFMYLLFGNERALLLDTGATKDPASFPLRATVDALIDRWLDGRPAESYGLVVAHTHGHADHRAADGQFTDRPNTTIVPREADHVRSYFGLASGEIVEFDLGSRMLEIIDSPGHHPAAITTYDPWTGLLLTGDTVLPGRLYAFDYPAFVQTLHRLVAFSQRRAVSHLLGGHIEMTNQPGRDFPFGARFHPNERALQLSVAQLVAVRDAAVAATGRKGRHRHDDFIIYNQPGTWDSLKLIARGLLHRAMQAVTGRLRRR
jgi:glyoxylase-like metal-dependent hydrolase (beta-lactamase superfamily II)